MQRYTNMEDNEEKQYNFRALNCKKAREQRSKIKEKKRQLKLLEITQMNEEINKIKNNLLKYTSIQPQTHQQPIKPSQGNLFNSFRL